MCRVQLTKPYSVPEKNKPIKVAIKCRGGGGGGLHVHMCVVGGWTLGWGRGKFLTRFATG